MKIKVCGMRDPQNIADIAALKPDYMGFIFYERSPRYAGEMNPKAMEVLSPQTQRVGVFVDSSEAFIRETAEKYGLDVVQLHGAESPAMCATLSNEYGIIKAFGIADGSDFDAVDKYEKICDMYVFDTKTAGHGGSGRKFDHSVLSAYKGNTSYMLSGGIGPEDVEFLVSFTDPRCVGFDINSRFETRPGLKDTAAVEQFMEKIKTQKK